MIRPYRHPNDRSLVAALYERISAHDLTVPRVDSVEWDRFVGLPQNRVGRDFRLAFVGSQVAGILMSSFRDNQFGALRHLRILVDPPFRRSGLGRELLATAARLDDTLDLHLQTLVPEEWKAAEAFYSKMRFQIANRELEMETRKLRPIAIDRCAWKVEHQPSPATIADAIAEIHNEAYSTSPTYIHFTPADMRTVLTTGVKVWKATVNSKLVGFCQLEDTQTGVWIESVAVRSDWRSRGLATDLLGQALAQSGVGPNRPAKLSVCDSNIGARSVYERLGFVVARYTARYRVKRIRALLAATA
ncbi:MULTISPECIES: GNAT family N-acetyltransferase [Bradyrhizobium]|nr:MULTISPECIES: GNAT family N-acetyltransferase [Bradyrhizobium]